MPPKPKTDVENRELRLECARIAVQASGTIPGTENPVFSYRAAAAKFNVSKSTLKRRAEGGLTRLEAHVQQQILAPGQEDALAAWIKAQGRRGLPLTGALIEAKVFALVGITPGENWIYRFRKRHPDLKVSLPFLPIPSSLTLDLQARWTVPLESNRGQALNRANVASFYDILADINELNSGIPPENIYNMDEKGVQLGIGDGHQRVLIDRAQRYATTLTDGGKEMVTVLETVCADGSATVRPYILYKGKRLQNAWYRDNPLGAWSVCSHHLQPRLTTSDLGWGFLKMDGRTLHMRLNG